MHWLRTAFCGILQWIFKDALRWVQAKLPLARMIGPLIQPPVGPGVLLVVGLGMDGADGVCYS